MNARHQNSAASALDSANFTPGSFPARKNTVTAEVLAALLESKVLTGLEAVFKANTTRLAASVEYIHREYNWPIERRAVAYGTDDGRIPTVKNYWFAQETIARAFEAGAREWIDAVKLARAARRKQAAYCKSEAAKRNASRKPKQHDPRQSSLWGDL
jgi:hypothetical protein